MNRPFHLTCCFTLAVVALVSLPSGDGFAQGPGVQTMPKAPRKDDVQEVEDVDAGMTTRVPKGLGTQVDGVDAADDPAFDAEVEREALALSQGELRARFRYLAAFTVGNARAWETYAVEGGAPISPEWLLTLYAGTGKLSTSGIEDEEAYDLTVEARSTGVDCRWYVPRLDGLSIGMTAGYVAWSGRVDPQGAEGDGEGEDGLPMTDPRLTSGFEATGIFGGLSAAVSWLWDNGVYLEWTLVGMRKSKVIERSVDRDSSLAEAVVERDLERVAFYGLANLKLGYFF